MIRLITVTSLLLSVMAGIAVAETEMNKDKTPPAEAKPAAKAAELEKKPDPAAMAAQLKILPGDFVMGDKNAKVTIFEYASLSCPHCAEFEETTLPRIYEKYIKPGKANLVFRDFPLNEPAFQASKLAKCAAIESKDKKDEIYFRYIKVLFASQKSWALNRNPKGMLQKIGALGGFSKESFDKCMENKEVEKEILESRKTAADVLKVTSTPTFFVGTKEIAGTKAFEEFAGAIEEQLKAK